MTVSPRTGARATNPSNLYQLYWQAIFRMNLEVLAKKILTESLSVRKGESVVVESWNTGFELAKKVVLEARRIGAVPIMVFEDEKSFIESAKIPNYAGVMGTHEYGMLAGTKAYVFIPGPPIAAYTRSITQEERTASTAYNVSWYEAAGKARLRGVRLSYGYIGKDIAKLYGKSVKSIAEHLVGASLIDFSKLKEKGKNIALMLEDLDACVESRAGKLTFRFQGNVIIEDGIVDEKDVEEGNNMAYMPPGRVRKYVDPKSVNGEIEIAFAEIYSGRVEGINMKFKDGALWDCNARRNAKLLNNLIDKIPENRRQMSFVEIGMNPVLKYGYAQDRFVSGAVTIGLPRFAGVMNKATLATKGKKIVEKGLLE